ncbi:MAG: chromosomal replication initiator DnaA [Acidithiobacillus sp.]|nr:chromosomal replication initiator DnaA [Acidithiobacillus sp.]
MALSSVLGQQLLPLQPRQLAGMTNLPGLHEEALAAIRQLREASTALCLYGDTGVGKTHLLLWAAFADGSWAPYVDCRALPAAGDGVLDLCAAPFLCLDNIDAWAGSLAREEELFRLFNYRLDRGLPWLVSCIAPRPRWLLADWESRLTALTSYYLKRPQDQQLDALLLQISTRFGPPFAEPLRRHMLRSETRNLSTLTRLVEAFQAWLWQRQATPSVAQWRIFREQTNV